MADEFLQSQLLSSPAKLEKKVSNTDILNCLFNIEMPATKKKEQPAQKNKQQDEINHYISSANKNKSLPSAPRPKDSHSAKLQPSRPNPAQSNPAPAQSAAKSTAQSHSKAAQPKAEKKEAKYMPTVVDIFAKKEDKNKSQKETNSLQQRIKPKTAQQPISKVSKQQVLKRKIERKREQERSEPIKLFKAAPKPATAPAQKEINMPKSVQQRPAKKKRQEPSSSSDSSASQSESSSESKEDWRKQLRATTGYDPAALKFRERDHMEIKQSGVDRIFGQDKFSYRMGREEEEQDLRLERERELRRAKQLKRKDQEHQIKRKDQEHQLKKKDQEHRR